MRCTNQCGNHPFISLVYPTTTQCAMYRQSQAPAHYSPLYQHLLLHHLELTVVLGITYHAISMSNKAIEYNKHLKNLSRQNL